MTQSIPVSRNTACLGYPASRFAIRTEDKGLRILKTVGKHPAELSLVELTRHLNIEKSTLHVAAVSITAPAALLSNERAAKLGPRLIAEVAEVSRDLGGRGHPRATPG